MTSVTAASAGNPLDANKKGRPNDTKSTSQDVEERLLSGHLGHLSEQQEQALAEFRELVAKEDAKGTEAEAVKTTTKSPLRNDITYLRFLRARRFDVQAALTQFHHSDAWRETNEIGKLYEHFDVAKFEAAKAYYPQWTGRRDKLGFPLYVYDLSSPGMSRFAQDITSAFDSNSHSSTSTANPQLHSLFVLSEHVFRFVQPLCSAVKERPHPERPITSTTNIIDLHGVGLRQFWGLKTHLQEASVLANTHYPEAVERIFVVGAPAIVPFFWNLIKNWFDPVTTAKIFILSASQVKPTLNTYVDAQDLPKKYGGELDWEWSRVPSLDALVKGKLRGTSSQSEHAAEDWIEGPVLWDDGKGAVVAVGTVDGVERRKAVGEKASLTEAVEEKTTVAEAVEGGRESGMKEESAPTTPAGETGTDKPVEKDLEKHKATSADAVVEKDAEKVPATVVETQAAAVSA